ncbi:uncharacterized protein [Oryctolagus cuniculus]|uniref:uncharacterized protein isoform X1 n=1 Tax=Oryctolagus cuniculus TaxID=9986 RepID=UPI002231C493|nr:uncharacterized protein LOC103345149 isoform X1 [Oryctolagus cuniculus]XP_051690673.1 uncharacterized protein LOC103345149 isoform X1 [Oryctolagus cuniculus]XP_051690674.1 uncharacterized protein LOC103345149 isoform X1 [Oryctolagus cuniculus]XP_051690675.1 uncharacterized protein LOC103345149 isoform X1 [Oryctolagus cuniculus]
MHKNFFKRKLSLWKYISLVVGLNQKSQQFKVRIFHLVRRWRKKEHPRLKGPMWHLMSRNIFSLTLVIYMKMVLKSMGQNLLTRALQCQKQVKDMQTFKWRQPEPCQLFLYQLFDFQFPQ